jgi:hypothetical protein
MTKPKKIVDLRLCNYPKGFILTLFRMFQVTLLLGNYGMKFGFKIYCLGIDLTLTSQRGNLCLEVPEARKR